MNFMKKGLFLIIKSAEYSQYIEEQEIKSVNDAQDSESYSDIRYCKIAVNQENLPFILPSALRSLSQEDAASFKLKSGRHPASSYRLSINRVTDKAVRLCSLIEQILKDVKDLEKLRLEHDRVSQILDYLELTLYSFSEHYDDMKDLVEKTVDNNSRAKRKIKSKIDKSTTRIRSITNHIKHSQKRLRLLFVQYLYDDELGLHIGFQIERCKENLVELDPVFHKNSSSFSINALLWEVVTSIYYMNAEVAEFIRNQKCVDEHLEEFGQEFSEVTKFLQCLLRLPIMSFDEPHVLIDNDIEFTFDEKLKVDELVSGLVGSYLKPWKNYTKRSYLAKAIQFEADSVAAKGTFNSNVTVRLFRR